MLERRAAGRMTNRVRRVAANRGGRRAPHLSARLVAQVEYVARRVTHRIVVPGCEPEEVAVLGPGETGAAFRDDKAAARIGDDVRPRSGRDAIPTNAHLVVTVRCDAAKSVVEEQWRGFWCRCRAPPP